MLHPLLAHLAVCGLITDDPAASWPFALFSPQAYFLISVLSADISSSRLSHLLASYSPCNIHDKLYWRTGLTTLIWYQAFGDWLALLYTSDPYNTTNNNICITTLLHRRILCFLFVVLMCRPDCWCFYPATVSFLLASFLRRLLLPIWSASLHFNLSPFPLASDAVSPLFIVIYPPVPYHTVELISFARVVSILFFYETTKKAECRVYYLILCTSYSMTFLISCTQGLSKLEALDCVAFRSPCRRQESGFHVEAAGRCA